MQQSLVLVLNCGSSSIKFAIINPRSDENKLSGLIQRIGTEDASFQWSYDDEKQEKPLKNIDYQSAVDEIVTLIHQTNELDKQIVAIGHRVVHGGELFTKSALIDNRVMDSIRTCSHLAPLHNPANITGITSAQKAFPNLPQVAVFDTAFHQTMPKYAYIYAIPYEFYEEFGVRRYGFHGTSHLYVTNKAAEMLNKPITQSAFICAHLGNGCSATAVLNGKSVDTTMGLTPLEGLVMGTRSGDVDPSLHGYLADTLGYDVHKVTEILNKKSGLLGISGLNADMRSITEAAEKQNERALLAAEIFCYRLAKYIMALMVPLGQLDALIFTGGIGENAAIIRAKVIHWLKIINLELDAKRNANHGKDSNGIITQEGKTIAMVVPTNEELLIARDTLDIVS